jgi:hypothetical protein
MVHKHINSQNISIYFHGVTPGSMFSEMGRTPYRRHDIDAQTLCLWVIALEIDSIPIHEVFG